MKDDLKWHLLQSRLHQIQAVEVTKLLDDAGIENIILKGSAIERFYPENEPRPSVDVDVAVSPDDYESAYAMFFKGDLKGLNVDMHNGLRHFDTRPWNEIYRKTKLIDGEEGSFRVLSDEDQLRVICVHWLTDGGERKGRLSDVYHVVDGARADDNFDWDYCLNANGPVRRNWILSTIALAAKYKDLDVNGLPFDADPDKLPVWLPKTLEKRWQDEIPFSPLDSNFSSISQFFGQLRRRFPPNAVMSTIGVEGKIDSDSRIPYQLRYFFKRLGPSFNRVLRSFVKTFLKR